MIITINMTIVRVMITRGKAMTVVEANAITEAAICGEAWTLIASNSRM